MKVKDLNEREMFICPCLASVGNTRKHTELASVCKTWALRKENKEKLASLIK